MSHLYAQQRADGEQQAALTPQQREASQKLMELMERQMERQKGEHGEADGEAVR
jgi:hypothetical protein